MKKQVNIGIIADYNETLSSHRATNLVLEYTADHLSAELNVTWLPTTSLLSPACRQELSQFDGIWVGPGTPYQSLEGALNGIRIAREADMPLIGT